MPGRPMRTPSDLAPLEATRIAAACRNEAYRLRQRLARGRVPPQHVRATEDRIVSLMVGDQVMRAHGEGGVPDGEGEDEPGPFVSIGDAVQRVVGRIADRAMAVDRNGTTGKEVAYGQR